jgi:signal peptidase I
MPEVSERPSQKRSRVDTSGPADSSSPLGRFTGGWAALLITTVARAVLATIALLLLITLAPAVLGWHPTVVSSGSMEPRLVVGDVIVSRPIGSVPLQLQQIILEKDPNHAGWLRLHRFVAMSGAGQAITKGDANAQRDTSSVPMSEVIGVASLRVPYLGLPAVWLGSGQYGKLATTAAVLGLLIGASLLFRQDRASGDGEEQPERRVRRIREQRRAHRGKTRPIGVAAASRRMAAVSVIGILITLVPAVSADAASFAAPTSNPSNALASANRFSCADRVLADSPANYYKLTEASGTSAADSSGNSHPGTYSSSGVTYGTTGPCSIDGATAVTLKGGTSTGITTSNAVPAPTTFSLEMWFNTTSSAGGLLIGMFSDPTSATANQDRVLYMTTAGKIAFGMYNTASGGSATTAASPLSYNDGAWHLADVTYSIAGGINLSVDGALVATNTAAVPANVYTGYWRMGYGGISYWPGAPSSNVGFVGSLASAAVYSQSLSSTKVALHYASTKGTCASAVLANAPSNFYKLNENGGTSAADASGNSIPGTYTSGVTFGTAGPCSVDGSTAATLNGANAGITTTNPIPRPATFSFEIWIKTTTTTGGLLMGVYSDPTAPAPAGEDPVLYMTNTGKMHFGMYDSFGAQSYNIESTGRTGTYNDGAWHMVDATYSNSAGMTLLVDGLSVGTNSGIPQNTYTGYLRIGYGSLAGWPNSPNSIGFTGSIANAALYPSVLTTAQVASHYAPR